MIFLKKQKTVYLKISIRMIVKNESQERTYRRDAFLQRGFRNGKGKHSERFEPVL